MSNSRLRKEENEESTFSKVAKFIGIVGAGALALTGVAIAGYAVKI
jgi:hypothetical protein